MIENRIGPFGAVRDKSDERDLVYTPSATSLPKSVDIRAHCGPCYDQMPLQSCSAHAVGSAITWLANHAGAPIPAPSRLFLYYNARRIEGTQATDSGATMRNAIKSIARDGTCPETDWPYDTTQFATQPPQRCYDDATVHAVSYRRLDRTLDAMRSCLAEGYPFVFAMEAYAQPFTAASSNGGHLAMPAAGDTLCGGHAVLAVGYDDYQETVAVLNSLGPTFGADGYFTMPYAYFTEPNLTYDLWTVRKIEASPRA